MQCQPPRSYLESAQKKEIFLMVPQVYELSRLINFVSTQELILFAKQRQQLGTEQWVVQPVRCSDGFVMLYPGKM